MSIRALSIDFGRGDATTPARELGAHELVAGGVGLAGIALGCTLELSSSLRRDLSHDEHVRVSLARCRSRPRATSL